MRLRQLGILALFGWSLGSAQILHNLQEVWTGRWPASVTAVPESCERYGHTLCSGDVNGDGLSDLIIATAPFFWLETDTTCGYVLIYYGRRGGVPDTLPDVIIRGRNPYYDFGRSLAVGDFNGDGISDLIVGAPLVQGIGYDSVPRAYVFLGPIGPADTVPDYILYGRHYVATQFGEAVACGDVNGDGYDDVIVGAYGDYPRPGDIYFGRVYVFYGGRSPDTIPDLILNGGHGGYSEAFGSDLAQPIDLNGDGIKDLVIGACEYGNLQGRLYIYFGGNPPDTMADVSMAGEVGGEFLGWTSLATLQGGAYNYVAIGSSCWPDSEPRGKVYVLAGGSPMDSIPDYCMVGKGSQSGLAMSLASAGHIWPSQGDGLIAGAAQEPGDYRGSVYIWEGDPYFDTVPDAWASGTEHSEGVGWAVKSAGDVDGDGLDEILVSNYASDRRSRQAWLYKYVSSGIGVNPPGLTEFPNEVRASPSPAVSHATLSFALPAAGRAKLRILDARGAVVRVLDNGVRIHEAGRSEFSWDLRDQAGRAVSAGAYFAELTQCGMSTTRKNGASQRCKFLVAR